MQEGSSKILKQGMKKPRLQNAAAVGFFLGPGAVSRSGRWICFSPVPDRAVDYSSPSRQLPVM